MKKIFVTLLALVTVFAFVACGNAVPQEDATADSGITEIVLAEGIPGFTLPEPVYEQELDESATPHTTHYYTNDAEGADRAVRTFKFEKEGLSLEEFTAREAEEYNACYGITDFLGTECGYYVASYARDGSFYYDQSWLFETDDAFWGFSKYYATEEIQIGDSRYYAWIPLDYTENDEKDSTFVASYTYEGNPDSNLTPFADFEVISFAWMDTGTYKDELEYYKDAPEEIPYTEQQFNKWIAADWDLDSVKEYYHAAYDILDEKDFVPDNNSLEMWMFEENTADAEGEEITSVRIIIPDDRIHYTAIRMHTAAEVWTHQGFALANTIHTK